MSRTRFWHPATGPFDREMMEAMGSGPIELRIAGGTAKWCRLPAPDPPGSSSEGPGEDAAAAAGGGAPADCTRDVAPFLQEEMLLNEEEADALDELAAELIVVAVKPGPVFAWMVKQRHNAEAVRVRWRTMPCGALMQLANLLHRIAPRHAQYLADMIRAKRRPPRVPSSEVKT